MRFKIIKKIIIKATNTSEGIIKNFKNSSKLGWGYGNTRVQLIRDPLIIT